MNDTNHTPHADTGAETPAQPVADVSRPAAPAPPPSPGVSGGGAVRRGAVLWGVTLVAIGGLLLISQLVPGIALWRYWPLIIVAIGVRQMLGPSVGHWSIKHAADGLVTVAFGLVFLGQMLGYLGWNVWLNLLRLWPLLLVAIGLEVAGKGLRSEWVRALGGVVIIGGLAYGSLVLTPTGSWMPIVPVAGQAETFSETEPHNARVDEGVATVRGGVGRMTVEAGDELVDARGRSAFEPDFEARVEGDSAAVDVGIGGTWMPMVEDAWLAVALDRRVAWDLAVDAGVSQYELDLREVPLRAFELKAGVSDGVVTLGRAGDGGERGGVPAKIEAGVSSLRVRVPAADRVRVTVSEGLSGVDARGQWTSTRDGGKRTFTSDGFRESGTWWEIDVTAGIGSIVIEYY